MPLLVFAQAHWSPARPVSHEHLNNVSDGFTLESVESLLHLKQTQRPWPLFEELAVRLCLEPGPSLQTPCLSALSCSEIQLWAAEFGVFKGETTQTHQRTGTNAYYAVGHLSMLWCLLCIEVIYNHKSAKLGGWHKSPRFYCSPFHLSDRQRKAQN